MIVEEIQVNGLNTWLSKPTEKEQTFNLFVHGGPGSHSHIFRSAVQGLEEYKSAENMGWITYDQRGCGKNLFEEGLSHQRNIDDLGQMIQSLSQRYPLNSIIGHSYGASLLFELNLRKPIPQNIMQVYLGFSQFASMPMQNSLLMDLQILKIHEPQQYNAALDILISSDSDIVRQSKKIRGLISNTALRKEYYWANKKAMNWASKVEKVVTVGERFEVFRDVVRSLREFEEYKSDRVKYLKETSANFLWINGFQDLLMNGQNSESIDGITCFVASGHYPHIEEPHEFLKLLSK